MMFTRSQSSKNTTDNVEHPLLDTLRKESGLQVQGKKICPREIWLETRCKSFLSFDLSDSKHQEQGGKVCDSVHEQRKVLDTMDLIVLLDSLLKNGNSAGDYLETISLAEEYERNGYLQHAVCCFVYAHFIKEKVDQVGEPLTAECALVVCCRKFSDITKARTNETLLHRFTSLGAHKIVHFLCANSVLLLQMDIANMINVLGTIRKETALVSACRDGYVDIAVTLIKFKADIIITDSVAQETCLHAACAAGREQIVTLLKENSEFSKIANLPDKKHLSNFTALHIAADSGYFSIFNTLLDAQVDVACRDIMDRSIFKVLVMSWKGDVQLQDQLACRLLTQHYQGFQDDINGTMLHFAIENGLEQLVTTYFTQVITKENILKFIDVACCKAVENLQMDEDIERGNRCKRVLAYLIKKAKDLSFSSEQLCEKIVSGFTGNVLCVAAYNGWGDIAECILDNFPKAVTYKSGGKFPIHYAVENRNDIVVVVQLLLQRHHASLGLQTDNLSLTPVHTSAQQGNSKIVRFLLQNGGDKYIDFVDSDGNTPLILAAKACRLISDDARYVEICALLIERNANISWRNREGKNALQVQTSKRGGRQSQVIQVLRQAIEPESAISSRHDSSFSSSSRLSSAICAPAEGEKEGGDFVVHQSRSKQVTFRKVLKSPLQQRGFFVSSIQSPDRSASTANTCLLS